LSVQERGYLLHHHKIILDKPPFYKSTLIFRNQLVKVPTQPICQDLGNQFDETMDKTYRLKILGVLNIFLFGSKVMKVELSSLKFRKSLLHTALMEAMASPLITSQQAL
jgi:hypothetical protein